MHQLLQEFVKVTGRREEAGVQAELSRGFLSVYPISSLRMPDPFPCQAVTTSSAPTSPACVARTLLRNTE